MPALLRGPFPTTVNTCGGGREGAEGGPSVRDFRWRSKRAPAPLFGPAAPDGVQGAGSEQRQAAFPSKNQTPQASKGNHLSDGV